MDEIDYSRVSGLLKKIPQKLSCEGSQQEPINGEITDASFMKILQKWKECFHARDIKFLDIGCGRGFLLYLASAYFAKDLSFSCGIDISEHRIEYFAYYLYCKLYQDYRSTCNNVVIILRDITKFESLV
jgi:SAM-dependent methyltransferase